MPDAQRSEFLAFIPARQAGFPGSTLVLEYSQPDRVDFALAEPDFFAATGS